MRRLTDHYSSVDVCTGPLYMPHQEPDGKSYIRYQVIGPSQVAVPTHFYKVIVCTEADGRVAASAAFVLPNAAVARGSQLSDFAVPIAAVEATAGLLFFRDLIDDSVKLNLDGAEPLLRNAARVLVPRLELSEASGGDGGNVAALRRTLKLPLEVRAAPSAGGAPRHLCDVVRCALPD